MNSDDRCEVVGANYKSTSAVPKGRDLLYRCELCGAVISSVSEESVACKCRNISIDADYFRLVVRDLSKLSVVRAVV